MKACQHRLHLVRELPAIFLFSICLGLFPFPSFFSHPFLSSRHPSTQPASTQTLPRSLRCCGSVALKGAGVQALCSRMLFSLLISSPSSLFPSQFTTTKFWVLFRVYHPTWLFRRSWGWRRENIEQMGGREEGLRN